MVIDVWLSVPPDKRASGLCKYYFGLRSFPPISLFDLAASFILVVAPHPPAGPGIFLELEWVTRKYWLFVPFQRTSASLKGVDSFTSTTLIHLLKKLQRLGSNCVMCLRSSVKYWICTFCNVWISWSWTIAMHWIIWCIHTPSFITDGFWNGHFNIHR